MSPVHRKFHLRKSMIPLVVSVALLGAASSAHAASVGINITGGASSGSMVPAAIATGAQTGRVFIGYSGGAAPDAGTLGAYDGIINGLVSGGVKPIIVVSGFGTPPGNFDDFASFMGVLAQRYAGKVIGWEVWNEPDEALGWGTAGGNPMAYAALLRTVYPKVHPYGPVVFGPLTANNYVFLQQVYQVLGGSSAGAFDVMAVHTDTACSLASPDAYERTADGHIGRFSFLGLIEVRRVMVEHGDGGKPIWVTELGWNSYQGTCTHGVYAGQKAAGVSEADQAKYLALAWHCLRGLPYVQHALWYDLQDLGGDSLYGILRGDGSKKPSYAAFQDVVAGKDVFAGQGCGDFVPPAISVRSPGEGSSHDDSLPIDATATDPSGVARITLLADGVKIRNFTGTIAAAYPKTRRAQMTWQAWSQLPAGPHTLRIVATDGSGNVGTKDVHVLRGGVAAPPPVAGKSGGVGTVTGRVCYYKPGSKRCIRLRGGELIPVGSIIDARKGKITLVVSDGEGGTDEGQFSGGIFVFTQATKAVPEVRAVAAKRALITNIKLTRGDFRKACRARSRKSSLSDWPGTFADTARRRVVRYLNAKAHGRFNVIGKRASGIERGTVWKTTDTCDATEIKVISGAVIVRDFKKRKNFLVKAGKTYRTGGGRR